MMERTSQNHRYSVMVLAHNEERHIEACLDSIFSADPDLDIEVFVMANGCTDCTESVVKEYANKNPSVHLVSIELGDKCNAWNVFVHEVVPVRCPTRAMYFFVDGDARFLPGSFSSMANLLASNSEAHAVSAPPASGRSKARDREELLAERGLVANLYGLSSNFVHRLIVEEVRIPLGLEGDDGLIGALIRWDLDPRRAMNVNLIVPCPDAGFVFESMNPTRLADWRDYWKRMVRYGRRRYEFTLLGGRLKSEGIKSMPVHISELYKYADKLTLTWDGVYTLTNFVALIKMRRTGKRHI